MIADKNCSGCGLCSLACPKKAIKMIEDQKGFYYPKINISSCVDCKLCTKLCSKIENKNTVKEVYILRHINEKIFSRSQSGGAFTLFSDFFLENNGIIYGAMLNNKFTLSHYRVTSKISRDKMHGSIYIQSNSFTVFDNIANDLLCKRKVLFIGTPCQISGIRKYLDFKKIDCTHFFCIDLLCHGVASPKLWKKLIEYYEKKSNHKIDNIQFKGYKENKRPYFVFVFGGKAISDTQFKKLYYSNLALRKSCYNCKYTSLDRLGDITIGDASNVKVKNQDFYNPKGTSLVLINNSKGKDLFDLTKKDAYYQKVKMSDYLQDSLQKSASTKRSPQDLWKDFEKKGMKYVISKYVNHNVFLNIKYILSRIYNR